MSVRSNGHGRRNGHRPLAQADAPVRVGVIGCGYWGPQLIRNFYELPAARLTGVAETRPERLEHVRHRYRGTQVFSDHRALLATDVDAIVIATPIQTHYALARDAILAGKHVLVEKPLTANVAEAMELISMAQAAGVTLMTGHTFLYNPAVQALRNLVDTGELGRVYYVDAARLSLGLFQSQVNVLWDLAPHDLVRVPPRTWHQFRATPTAPLGFLCLVACGRDRPERPALPADRRTGRLRPA